jgi:hypothetical protein
MGFSIIVTRILNLWIGCGGLEELVEVECNAIEADEWIVGILGTLTETILLIWRCLYAESLCWS